MQICCFIAILVSAAILLIWFNKMQSLSSRMKCAVPGWFEEHMLWTVEWWFDDTYAQAA